MSIVLLFAFVLALNNGVGKTPFLGWNSWNKFVCDGINESVVRDMADRIVELGLDKLGYEYVNVDDCWLTDRRSEDGYMITDNSKFPSGMKALGDYIHSKGLKFGIYSSAGIRTCARRMGSLYHEQKDAELFAYFGVDLLKYDNCFNQGMGSREGSIKRYSAMGDALAQRNRTILYSLCQWGESQPWLWAESIGNTFRTTADITHRFDGYDPRCPCTTTNCTRFGYSCSVLNILDKQAEITKYGRPGFFLDMDMLEVGVGGLSFEESKSHFFLWAALKSPLIIGADLNTISDEDLGIFKMEEVIAVNQDPLGKSASLIRRVHNKYDIWAGPLVDGAVAVLLNRSRRPLKITLPAILIKWLSCKGLQMSATDLYSMTTHNFKLEYESPEIPSHGSVMLKLSCPDSSSVKMSYQ